MLETSGIMALSPDGRTLYVTTMNDDAGPSPGGGPRAMVGAMAPDGKTVWVVSITGERNSTADNTVTPVAVDSDRPGRSFRTSGWLNEEANIPLAVAISPDGRTLYVTVPSGLARFTTAG